MWFIQVSRLLFKSGHHRLSQPIFQMHIFIIKAGREINDKVTVTFSFRKVVNKKRCPKQSKSQATSRKSFKLLDHEQAENVSPGL